MEKYRRPQYPLPDYLRQDKEREKLTRIQSARRNFLRGCAKYGTIALGAGGLLAWAAGEVTHDLKSSHCVNCGPSPDSQTTLKNNNAAQGTDTPTYEYNGIPYEPMRKLSPVTLANGQQADIIAPFYSTEDTIAPLDPGSAMFIALWNGTVQYGCLNGEVEWLRKTVSQNKAVFHDYQHSQKGYTGQALWIDINQATSQVMPGHPACNRPTYCIAPNEAGEFAYVAGVLTPGTNRAHSAAYLRAILADPSFGGPPEPTVLTASETSW